MIRRAGALTFKAPRKKNYSRPACLNWLQKTPIVNSDDIKFITDEVKNFSAALSNEEKEQNVLLGESKKKAFWTTINPHLRLWHCLTHDMSKVVFNKTQDVLNREELDGRNNYERPKTYWEVVSGLFNDVSFEPTSYLLSDLHHSFENTYL